MRIEVTVPDPGEDGPKEASVSFWMFEVGDKVSAGEDLVELVTDKATFSMPSPIAGKIKELLVAEGDSVNVGQAIAIIE